MKKIKKTLIDEEEQPPVIEEPPSPEPLDEPDQGKGDLLKVAALIVLVAVVAVLAYYLLMPSNTFPAGASVDPETFKGVFDSAQNVYIVMDVRGISDSATRQNILQCGVDFAASSGMGGKNVTYYSIADDGCYTVDGTLSAEQCLASLKDGITIYVEEGSPGAKYYSNGMVVTLGSKYTVGTCGIHRA